MHRPRHAQAGAVFGCGVGLVCRMLSCIHEMDSDTAATEAKVAAHMLAPDSDPEDEVKSDEDLTYEDLEAVGMRHVFYYE